jgi:hypothetical protein
MLAGLNLVSMLQVSSGNRSSNGTVPRMTSFWNSIVVQLASWPPRIEQIARQRCAVVQRCRPTEVCVKVFKNLAEQPNNASVKGDAFTRLHRHLKSENVRRLALNIDRCERARTAVLARHQTAEFWGRVACVIKRRFYDTLDVERTRNIEQTRDRWTSADRAVCPTTMISTPASSWLHEKPAPRRE